MSKVQLESWEELGRVRSMLTENRDSVPQKEPQMLRLGEAKNKSFGGATRTGRHSFDNENAQW